MGYAELLLGAAIRELGLDREELVAATKVAGRMSPGPNGEGLSRKHVMWRGSGKCLQARGEYRDMSYVLHGPQPEDPREA